MYKGDKKKFGQAALAEMEKRKTLQHLRMPDENNDNLYKGKAVPGQQIYITYCSSCHQRNGKGDGNRFPPLEGSEWVTGDKKRLIKVVLNGLNDPIEVKGKPYNNLMPPHSFLKDEEIAEVVSYIRKRFNGLDSIKPKEVSMARKSSNNKK